MTKLTYLDVKEIYFGEIDKVRQLSELQQLTHLDISDTNLGDEGVKYISTMKQLNIMSRSEGVSYISQLKQLTFLNLNGNQLEEANEAIKSISELYNLTYLDISNISDNNLRNPFIQGVEYLGKLENLTELYITQIGNEGLKNINKLKKLRVLDISSVPFYEFDKEKNKFFAK